MIGVLVLNVIWMGRFSLTINNPVECPGESMFLMIKPISRSMGWGTYIYKFYGDR